MFLTTIKEILKVYRTNNIHLKPDRVCEQQKTPAVRLIKIIFYKTAENGLKTIVLFELLKIN